MIEILDIGHDMAKDLHAVGAMNANTMRMMDELFLPKKRSFTVAKWKQGLKRLGGASARLLDVIDRKGIEAIV
jgi:putative transcriptional regulator